MKKYILLLFLASIAACSEDDKGPGAKSLDANVNDITIDLQQMTTPTVPEDSGPYDVWMAMAGDNIYYANPSNTNLPQFMLAYDMSANTFSHKLPHAQVCACGYGSRLISTGTELYYIANDAVKYSIADDEWSDINYPVNVAENNGETGIAYNNGKIYFLGGRDFKKTFKYYDTAADSWFNVPDYPVAVKSPDLVAVKDKIYAIGGTQDSRKFSVYTEGGSWEELPDVPFLPRNLYKTYTVTAFQDRYIFAIVYGEGMHIYDTKTNEWRNEPIAIGGFDGFADNLFADDQYLYIASKTNDNDFKLQKITIGTAQE